MKKITQKLNSIRLCLESHPDNEPNSEFADRIEDLNELPQMIEEYASQFQPNWIKGLPPEDFGFCILNTIDEGIVTGDTQVMKDNFEQWKENVTHYSTRPVIQPPKED